MSEAAVEAARGQGWKVGNAGEARVALALTRMGYRPDLVETQFHIGPYRLDFALVAERIDIEADGWVHTAATTRQRDGRRDRQLRNWGWTVARINVDEPVDEQLAARVPSPRLAARYGQAMESIGASIAGAFMRLARGRTEPYESAACVRAAVRHACAGFPENAARYRPCLSCGYDRRTPI
jgi:hypothetical protein